MHVTHFVPLLLTHLNPALKQMHDIQGPYNRPL